MITSLASAWDYVESQFGAQEIDSGEGHKRRMMMSGLSDEAGAHPTLGM
jgi:hypothetical protein